MNTFKGWITTFIIGVALLVSTAPANAGVIIGGAIDNTPVPCQEPAKDSTKTSADFGGIIIGGASFGGIIIGGASLIGIIIGGATDDGGSTNCGVIIGG